MKVAALPLRRQTLPIRIAALVPLLLLDGKEEGMPMSSALPPCPVLVSRTTRLSTTDHDCSNCRVRVQDGSTQRGLQETSRSSLDYPLER